MDRFAELGAKYVVLAIDGINSLHDDCKDGFRKLVHSISRAVRAHNKRLFVLFAGECNFTSAVNLIILSRYSSHSLKGGYL